MNEITPYEINAYKYGNVLYIPNPQHRDGNPNKSQWLIDIDQEVRVFKYMAYNNWGGENNGWGLFFRRNILDYLGIIHSRNTNVFIAKFVVDTSHCAWHGYPADYQFKAQDVPDRSILQDWLEKKYLSKAKIRKIMKGQPCKI